MMNTIIQVLPTLLLICAILIILVNIRALLAYYLYIISMAAQPQKLIKTAIQLEKNKKYQKKSYTQFLLPLIRVKTIIQILLFPDIDSAYIVHKNKK